MGKYHILNIDISSLNAQVPSVIELGVVPFGEGNWANRCSTHIPVVKMVMTGGWVLVGLPEVTKGWCYLGYRRDVTERIVINGCIKVP